MAVFAYNAVDSRTQGVRGTIAADSPREAREKLRSQGLYFEAVTLRDGWPISQWRLIERPGRRAVQLTLAVRDLATLLGAGIDLVDALDTLSAQYRGRFQASLLSLREQVASGSSLSEAMRADPAIYDELTIQMTSVGENAGTLDTVLDRLADFRERYLLFKDRITRRPSCIRRLSLP